MSLPVRKSGACVLRRIHRAPSRGSKSFCPRAAVRWYRWPVCYYLFILPSITSLSLFNSFFVNTTCLQGEDPSICTMMQIIYICDKEQRRETDFYIEESSRSNLFEYIYRKFRSICRIISKRILIPKKNNYKEHYRERRIFLTAFSSDDRTIDEA